MKKHIKKHFSPAAETRTSLRLQAILLGSGILILTMLIITVYSIVRALRAPVAMRINVETSGVLPDLSEEEEEEEVGAAPAPAPFPWETKTASSNQPLWMTEPDKFVEQRRSARLAAFEEIQRQHEKIAPAEIREQRKQQRNALIEAAKQELIEQAGTSGVPKEVLRKLESSNPLPF